MPANVRLLELQQDLTHSAGKLEELCLGLDGHARYLRHSVHAAEVGNMGQQADELRTSAADMRELAALIRP